MLYNLGTLIMLFSGIIVSWYVAIKMLENYFGE